MTFANNLDASFQGFLQGASGTFNARIFTGTANQISISEGAGNAGNPTYSLTSTIQVSGISFDSGSNTLSSYSQGTFTPTFTATTPPTVTYVSNGQIGNYTQIGLKVITNYRVALATLSGGSGSWFIGNLPFTSNSATDSYSNGPNTIQNATISAAVNYSCGVIATSSTQCISRKSEDGSAFASFTITNATASTIITGSLMYNI